MMDLIDCSLGKRKVWADVQFLISTEEEVIKIIEEWNGFKNLGISSCAYVNGDEVLLYLFFDFDSKEDISIAWNDAVKCYNHFMEMGISCYAQFSGSKGLHVLVEVEPKNYASKQLKEVQLFYRDMLGLETLDEQILGQKNRIFRIPNTFNVNGTWCRTLAYSNGNKLDLDDIIPEVYEPDKPKSEETKENDEIRYFKRPCIEWAVSPDSRDYWIEHHPRGKFEPSESVRLSWAGIRIWAGKTIDEVVEESSRYGWEDWDESIVRKKLEYLYDRKWTPHNCDSLESMGYCFDWIDCKRKQRKLMEKLGIGNGGI